MLDRYLVLDAETSGLDPAVHHIIELAAIRVEGGQITGEFSSLFRLPDGAAELSEKITRITGIAPADLADAPLFREKIAEIRDFCGDLPIIGHNPDFDTRFLALSGLELPGPVLDTQILAEGLFPALPSGALEILTEKLGIGHADAHRAMADVRATRELFEILRAGYAALPEARRAALSRLAEAVPAIKIYGEIWSGVAPKAAEIPREISPAPEPGPAAVDFAKKIWTAGPREIARQIFDDGEFLAAVAATRPAGARAVVVAGGAAGLADRAGWPAGVDFPGLAAAPIDPEKFSAAVADFAAGDGASGRFLPDPVRAEARSLRAGFFWKMTALGAAGSPEPRAFSPTELNLKTPPARALFAEISAAADPAAPENPAEILAISPRDFFENPGIAAGRRLIFSDLFWAAGTLENLATRRLAAADLPIAAIEKLCKLFPAPRDSAWDETREIDAPTAARARAAGIPALADDPADRAFLEEIFGEKSPGDTLRLAIVSPRGEVRLQVTPVRLGEIFSEKLFLSSRGNESDRGDLSENFEKNAQIASPSARNDKSKKPRALILHGYTGTPEANFLPATRRILEDRGFAVAAPELPGGEDPDLDDWIARAGGEFEIVVAASLGAWAAARAMAGGSLRAKKTIFIAPVGAAGWSNPDEVARVKNFPGEFSPKDFLKNAGALRAIFDSTDQFISGEFRDWWDGVLPAGSALEIPAQDWHFNAADEPDLLVEIEKFLGPARDGSPAPTAIFAGIPATDTAQYLDFLLDLRGAGFEIPDAPEPRGFPSVGAIRGRTEPPKIAGETADFAYALLPPTDRLPRAGFLTSDTSEPNNFWLEKCLRDAVPRLGPRAVVLTGSVAMASNWATRLEKSFENRRVLGEGISGGRPKVAEFFKNSAESVLFCRAEFFRTLAVRPTGIAVLKIGWDHPLDPILRARIRAAESLGGSGFSEISLPRALGKFFGAMPARPAGDGAVVFVDPGLRKNWGGWILDEPGAARG